MPAQEFRQGMDDDVGAILDRLQQKRRGDGIVDDQWHAVTVGDVGEAFDVADITRGIADAFAVDRPRVFIDELFHVARVIRFGKSRRDVEPRQDMGE